MKKERIFWGLFLIFGAVFLIVSKLGLVEGIGFWTVIGTIFFGCILLSSLIKLRFTGIFFSLAFLGIIYDEQLGIQAVTPWPILGAALLLSIGFGIIFKKNTTKCWKKKKDTDYETIIDEEDGNRISFDTSFGASIKYVNTDDFQSASLDCSFGSMKVYFDNAMMQQPQATIYLDASFSGVELYIPKSWAMINKVHAAFGAVEEKNQNVPDGVHSVILTGECNFSGVTIIYV